MPVEVVQHGTKEIIDAINALIPQLSRSAPQLTEGEALRVIDQLGVDLLIYRSVEGGPIQGMLTLATFYIPTGLRAWIEDVVVDSSARGKGAGKELVDAAVEHAAAMGCRTVDLTSRPTREEANRLYKRCGFNLRETNVYRFEA